MAFHFRDEIRHALAIGGGGYSYPQHFIMNNLDAHMDVVEIDERVTEIAKEFFGLADTLSVADSRLQIIHQDARIFLNNNNNRYDAIFGDAFNANTPPFQLLTREAKTLIYNSLNEGGVFIVNLISSFEGERSQLLSAYYRTIREVFPQVYLFAPSQRLPDILQNVIIVAIKSDEPIVFANIDPHLQTLLDQRFVGEIPLHYPVLTDNHAPVEFYTRFF